MTHEEALEVLHCNANSDLDDILEAYQQQIFDIKNWFFRTTLVPVLALKRLNQLKNYQEALVVLVEESDIAEEFDYADEEFTSESKANHWINVFHKLTPEAFLTDYENQVARYKLIFSQNWFGKALISAFEVLIALEVAYEYLMNSFFWQTISDTFLKLSVNETIKQADKKLSSEWIKALEMLGWKEHVMEPQVLDKSPVMDLFVTEVFRCKKGVEFALKKGMLESVNV